MSMKHIKPCACGSTDTDIVTEYRPPLRSSYRVQCFSCGAKGFSGTIIQDAVSNWNYDIALQIISWADQT